MKELLDIKVSKASSLLDVLNRLSYVKATPLTENKALLINEIKEAVEELKLVKAGKKNCKKC